MITMILKDHGISLLFPRDITFSETKKGMWLYDNNIDFRVSETSIEDIIAVNIEGEIEDVISVLSIDFFNEEDFTAFKLRWCD